LIHKIAQVGLDIKHIRRSNRTGYKAGALKEGLPRIIAILMLILYLKRLAQNHSL
jgi:hypothetical protein